MDRVAEEPAFGAPRTPVVFDSAAGALRIGPYERRIDDPDSPDQVYGAYLSLLYAVRAARPGERLSLRSADLEALLLLVGDDPATIESRLVELMGCTPEEAGRLAGILLRHRRMTATLGIAAGLSLAGVGLASQLPDDEPVRAPQAIASAPAPQAAAVGPVAPAPVTSTPPAAPTDPAPVAPTSVVVAQPTFVGPVAAAPAPAPVAPAVAPEAAPVAAPAAPVVGPPVVAAPVAEPVLVTEPADPLALPSFPEPVMDAPPPVEPEPDAAVGPPAIVVIGDGTVIEIGGVVQDGEAVEPPVAPPAELPVVPPVSDTATAAIG